VRGRPGSEWGRETDEPPVPVGRDAHRSRSGESFAVPDCLVIVETEQRAITGARIRLVEEPSGGALTEQAKPRAGGDDERAHAFRRLADSHLHEAYRLASAILADPVGAEDAVHDAFVRAWDKWPTLRDHSKFEPWFKRIVVNTCRNRLRLEARRRTSDLAQSFDGAAPDASRSVSARDEVERALRRLKPDDRVVLALRYYRDLKIGDIADLLDVPSGTATSRLRAAHVRLRTALEQHGDRGTDR
jgi:RNA polymerase sigma-70 factor, ECF subfamily